MSKNGKFFDREYFKVLLTLALPITLQNFLVFSLNMLDTFMIGKVGEYELAAVGVANKLSFLFHITAAGVAAGCSIYMAQYWGKRDVVGIRKVMGAGLAGCFFVSLFFTAAAMLFPAHILQLFSNDGIVIALGKEYLIAVCISYIFTGATILFNNFLMCIGHAKTPMYVSFFAILCNGILNYILIFGKFGFPAMGVRGAAIATVTARMFEAAVTAFLIFSRHSPLQGNVVNLFVFDFVFIRQLAGKSAPIVLNEMLYALGTWMYTIAYGNIGTGALAAAQITQTVSDLLFVLAFGISGAALVIVGNLIGAGDEARAVQYAWKITASCLILGVFTGGIIVIAAGYIVGFFNITAQTAQTATSILRIQGAFGAFATTGTMLIVGVFRGAGDASYAFKAEMLAMWCIAIPLAFLGSYVWGFTAVAVAILMQTEGIVKFVIGMLHLKRGKWIHHVDKTSAV